MPPAPTDQTIESARTIFSRAARHIRLGGDGNGLLRDALAQLAAMRDALRGSERRQVEIYLGLLQEEWADRPTAAFIVGAPAHLGEAQRVVLHAFQQEGSRSHRLATTREALGALAILARQASDRGERSAIARLSEPVILLLNKLESRQR